LEHDDHEDGWTQDTRQDMRVAQQQDEGKYPLARGKPPPRGYKWVSLDEAMEKATRWSSPAPSSGYHTFRREGDGGAWMFEKADALTPQGDFQLIGWDFTPNR
jgi:hypothetical protein